jgi:hypothetical protein
MVLPKLNTEFLYDVAIPLLFGTYPKELETDVQTDPHSQIFIAALLTVGKRWKQPKPKCSVYIYIYRILIHP